MSCPIQKNCTFFNKQLHMLEERRKNIESRFCQSGYGQCARYKMYEYYKKPDLVPPDLMPNNYEKVEQIIRADKKMGWTPKLKPQAPESKYKSPDPNKGYMG